jgi:hypothetical protein
MSEKQQALVGGAILDPHKNTARCKRVNDRLRRRAKRLDRQSWKQELQTDDDET